MHCNKLYRFEHQGFSTEKVCRMLFKHIWLRSCYCTTIVLLLHLGLRLRLFFLLSLLVLLSFGWPHCICESLRAPYAFFASAPRELPGAAARRFLHQGQIGRGANARGFQVRCPNIQTYIHTYLDTLHVYGFKRSIP